MFENIPPHNPIQPVSLEISAESGTPPKSSATADTAQKAAHTALHIETKKPSVHKTATTKEAFVQKPEIPKQNPFSEEAIEQMAASAKLSKPWPKATKTFEYYRKKFQLLNEKASTTGLLRLFHRLWTRIANVFSFFFRNISPTILWQTHVTAEHMSQGNLSGNSDWDATERTLHVLQKMSHPPTSVIQALQYALKIQKNLLFKTGIAHRVQRDVKKLEPGQSVAVPSSAKGHAMMMMITCVGKKPSGEKRYTVVQHNTGAGIANYHYYNRSMNGRPKYQTALEITDVSEEALCGHSSRFFSRLFALEESPVKKLYTKVIPLLRGTIAPPSSDPRLWSHGQIGGSCSASCGLSLIRSQLDRETFKEFRERSRIEMILESFQQIKEGGESSTDQKIVTLEVVRKLMHIYDRRGLPLPKELEETKKQLEEISSQSSQKIASFEKALLQKGLIKRTLHGQPFEVVDDGTGKLYGKDSADNINIAFSLIREGNFSQESLELAVKYIEKAVSLRTGLPCTQEENEKLLNIGFSMTSMLKDRPLTAEQMYVATAMTALAFDAIPTIRESRSIKKNLTELENFAVNLQNSFLALNKRAYDHRPILDSLILNQQDRLFGSSSSYQQIHTPSGMTYLKQRMEKNRHTAEGA